MPNEREIAEAVAHIRTALDMVLFRDDMVAEELQQALEYLDVDEAND